MPDLRFVVFAARRKPPATSWSRAVLAGGHSFAGFIRAKAGPHGLGQSDLRRCVGGFRGRRPEPRTECASDLAHGVVARHHGGGQRFRRDSGI